MLSKFLICLCFPRPQKFCFYWSGLLPSRDHWAMGLQRFAEMLKMSDYQHSASWLLHLGSWGWKAGALAKQLHHLAQAEKTFKRKGESKPSEATFIFCSKAKQQGLWPAGEEDWDGDHLLSCILLSLGSYCRFWCRLSELQATASLHKVSCEHRTPSVPKYLFYPAAKAKCSQVVCTTLRISLFCYGGSALQMQPW